MTNARLMVVNVGSSSCKVTISADGHATERDTGDSSPLEWGAERWREFTAAQEPGFEPEIVLHRFVHGGGVFHAPTVMTDAVGRQLDDLIPLAPLHMANARAVAETIAQAFPGARAIACFDTTFHESLAPETYTYAVPSAWRDEHGIRKYGFHGLAHDYADSRARELLAGRAPRRVLSCHLGSGSSLAAIVDGTSVDTTMGFTPIDGLVMSTRGGSIDPGALLWLLTTGAVDATSMSEALEHDSGLTALAGTGDLRSIDSAAASGDDTATLAYSVWRHRLLGQLGSMIAVMGGVDAIVFGGGIGENAWQARADVLGSLDYLGVEVDETANREARSDAVISGADSRVAVVVVAAREDLAMIRRTEEAGLIDGPPRSAPV